MKTITDISEINSTTGDPLTEPTIPYSDDMVRKAPGKFSNTYHFTGEDAMVYDFLGCLELFMMGSMFIYGDESPSDTINNRVRSGNIDFNNMKMLYITQIFGLSLDSCRDDVPDSVVEVSAKYRKLHKKYYDKFKDDRVFGRALNLLAKNACP